MNVSRSIRMAWLGLIVGAMGHSICAAGEAMETQLKQAGGNAGEIRGFLEEATKKHGDFGGRAARFLVEGMPQRDLLTLKKDFLLENLSLALKTRQDFAWAKKLSDELFFNDVLPYASLDETREPWRREFYEITKAIVKDCKTADEAVQALNKNFFNQYKVHYNRGRKAPNQSPGESKALGMATCTGLSIILVDACRAVGVPARVTGTPLWANKGGNHSWAEVYANGQWNFTGSDEYDKRGLNNAWFTKDTIHAIENDWRHAVWASSWKKTGSPFPMVWAIRDQSVAGVNVTARYTKDAPKATGPLVPIHLRVFDKKGGKRIVVRVEMLNKDGVVKAVVNTKAGTADMNDMPSLQVSPNKGFHLFLVHGRSAKEVTLTVKEERTEDLIWSELKNVEPKKK